MEIAGVRHHWAVGRAFLFDDTFRHSVCNDSSEPRVVLLLDVERPMTARGRLLLRASIRLLEATHYVKDGVRNQRRWEEEVGLPILYRREDEGQLDFGRLTSGSPHGAGRMET